jgi:hypothetical protein
MRINAQEDLRNRADAETPGGQKRATMKNHVGEEWDFDRRLKQPTATMRRGLITSGTVAMRSGGAIFAPGTKEPCSEGVRQRGSEVTLI